MFGSAAGERLAREILDELRYIRQHSSVTAERLGMYVVNNVLEVSTRIFDSDGRVVLEWQTTCGAIEVGNLTDDDVTVANGTTAVEPLQGVGMFVVPAGARQPVNVNARAVTLFGTAGGTVTIQAWTTGYKPAGAAVGSINGGAP